MPTKRMVIVSSYNEACGNASYTHVLKNEFARHVECDVIALDLFLLQKIEKPFVKVGDRHIREIAEKLKKYDYVNIQFEAGLYGVAQADILRRVKILLDACKNATFTMHRIDPPRNYISSIVSKCWDIFWTRGPVGVFHHIVKSVGMRRDELLYAQIIENIRHRKSRGQNIWIAVHTRRERRIVEEFFDYKFVFDFPITFLRPEERKELLVSIDKTSFHKKHFVGPGVKVIGAFGFIADYKAYETLVNALALMPEEYHLYIFGSQHPQSLQPNVPIDSYLKRLLQLVDGKGVWFEEASGAAKNAGASIPGLGLTDRVHFVGGLKDPDFLEALSLSDAVVLPYLEVGQSMSGVVSLALEANANLFCANNLSMNEVRRYYGEVYTTFDIGNYVELAQKLQVVQPDFIAQREKSYAKYNIVENVRLHLEALGHNSQGASQ